MRLALIADVHLDASFSWAGPAVGRRLRQAVRDALRRATERAADLKVDAFLIAGDLFEDDRYAPDTPEFLRGLFAELAPIPVLLAPGNHDFAGRTSPYRTIQWSPNVHVFAERELSPHRLADGLAIWAAGHDRPADTPGFFDRGFRVNGSGVHLALFHGAERGSLFLQEEGKQLHAPFDEAQVAEAGFVYAFVGHYHRPRDTTVLSYPGNLERLAFGETGERGLVLAEVRQDGQVAIRREVLAKTAMHDVSVDATGCQTVDAICERVRAALEALPGSEGVRVARLALSGDIPEDLDVREADLLAIPTDLDALTTRPLQLHAAYDVDRIAKEVTVRGSFVRLVREAPDLDNAEREFVLRAGLRALAGRSDLEVI